MSISIDNSLFNQYGSNTIQKSDIIAKLEGKLTDNLDEATDEELMDVCKSFESYFVEQVFKEMRNTVPNSDEQGEYMQYFGDMLYQQYAQDVTDSGGVGIAKLLYESMKRNNI